MSKEIWKDIKGYEGLYQVSNLGRVKSLDRKVESIQGKEWRLKGKLLNQSLTRGGYLKVELNNGRSKTVQVHRLVAEAFIPNPLKLPQVNHKREFEKENNRVDNLEWCTNKYNINYGTARNRMAKTLMKPIIGENIKDGSQIRFDSIKDAERLGFNKSHISSCCRGKRNTHGGYKWRYD